MVQLTICKICKPRLEQHNWVHSFCRNEHEFDYMAIQVSVVTQWILTSVNCPVWYKIDAFIEVFRK